MDKIIPHIENNNYCLIIGIDDYVGMPPLSNAVKDAVFGRLKRARPGVLNTIINSGAARGLLASRSFASMVCTRDNMRARTAPGRSARARRRAMAFAISAGESS